MVVRCTDGASQMLTHDSMHPCLTSFSMCRRQPLKIVITQIFVDGGKVGKGDDASLSIYLRTTTTHPMSCRRCTHVCDTCRVTVMRRSTHWFTTVRH